MFLSEEFKQKLVECICREMGAGLKSIVLYGSVAKGTSTDESDVDIALFVDMNDEKSYESTIVSVAALEIDYGLVVSLQMICLDDFHRWENVLPYYMNIKNEGIQLWKAA